MKWTDFVTLLLVCLAWTPLFIQFRSARRLRKHLREVYAESHETWKLLLECQKVLAVHDDLNSRRLTQKIIEHCKGVSLDMPDL